MKKLLFIPIIMFHFFASGQNASLSGVITYFFNEAQGNKPDLGAKIFLIEIGKADFFDFKSYDSLRNAIDYLGYANGYTQMISNYLSISKKKFKSKIEELEITQNEHLKNYKLYLGSHTISELDHKLSASLTKLEAIAISSKTIDATGSYVFKNIPPNNYYILIISKGRDGSYSSSVLGKPFINVVELQKDSEKDYSHNFELNGL